MYYTGLKITLQTRFKENISLVKMKFTKQELDDFIEGKYLSFDMLTNGGGMLPPDLFSFYVVLKTINPKVVIESGVYNGISTKFIRRVLGDNVYIICLDPRPIPSEGYTDTNPRTSYFVGDKFVDFDKLDLSGFNREQMLCFFDDHQNAVQRVLQCIQKGVKHLFFNDNYPVGAGSHYTLQHLLLNDNRQVFDLHNQYPYSLNVFPQVPLDVRGFIKTMIREYQIFSNVYPSKIYLSEGTFESQGILSAEEHNPKYNIFLKCAANYNWNTYVRLFD